MTATQAPPTYSSGRVWWPGRQVISTDLWYPGQCDPIGRSHANNLPDQGLRYDLGIYIVWVASDSQRGGQQPRLALHVTERP